MSQINSTAQTPVPEKPRAYKENVFLSLLFNIVLPVFILTKLSSPNALGPLYALFTAILFPLAYGIFDLVKAKRTNYISILGVVSITIKGLFALFSLDVFWFAVQEGSLPMIFGLITILSIYFKKPLINYFLYNEAIFNTTLLENRIAEKGKTEEFSRVLITITFFFGFAFMLSGIANFFIARHVIIHPVGTEDFNNDLAQMKVYSYTILGIPKLVLSILGGWWFVKKLKELTGLGFSELLKQN